MRYNNEDFDLELLLRELKREDNRNLTMTHSFKWIMWILAPTYFIFFLIRLMSGRFEIDKIGFLFFSLGFLSFALLFKRFHKEYKAVDYGVSTLEMLRNVVSRYALWQTKSYLGLLAGILCALGFSFSAQRLFQFDTQGMRIFIAFLSILFVLTCSATCGYFIWRRRQKPLRDKALSLLKEMGE